MKLEQLKTIGQLEAFLSGTQSVAFAVASNKDSNYRWIQGELVRFQYLSCARADKGVVIRYLIKVSGYTQSASRGRLFPPAADPADHTIPQDRPHPAPTTDAVGIPDNVYESRYQPVSRHGRAP